MNAKMFSYKVEGVYLEQFNDTLKTSKSFDRKVVLALLKDVFTAEGYKIDEGSLSYKLIDDQLYIQGLAIEKEEPKTVGFRLGK